MAKTKLSPEVIEQARALLLDGHGITATASKLGMQRSQLERLRKCMVANGEIDIVNVPWSDHDRTLLEDLLDRGYGCMFIARRLKRSENSVRSAIKRFGLKMFGERKHVLSQVEAAGLLGITPMVVKNWRKYGLKVLRSDWSLFARWRIDWTDLVEWLEEPTHWPLYDPTACTEPALREHLIEIRHGQPRWLTMQEVADRYCVAHVTVSRWCTSGVLPSTVMGFRYIRESDLEHFTPPYERNSDHND